MDINNLRKEGLGPQSEVEKKGVEMKPLSLSDLKKYLKGDLHACLLMLQAIHDDQDTLDLLAQVLHGKYLNHQHKQELAKQTELAI